MTGLKVKSGRWWDHAVEVNRPDPDGNLVVITMVCGQLEAYSLIGQDVEHLLRKMRDWSPDNSQACPRCVELLRQRADTTA